MLKQVLLKCSCSIVVLFFILRSSNCSSEFIQIPPDLGTIATNEEEDVQESSEDPETELPSDQSNSNEMDDSEWSYSFTDTDIDKYKLWPGAVIPYYIDIISFDKVLRDRIRSFLSKVYIQTGIKFMELPTAPKETDTTTRWVFFINRRGLLGCADHSIHNFTNKGVQRVLLGYDCMSTGGELAETVLAIAGVPSQHSAPNRDNYIKVNEENIQPEKRFLFEKVKDTDWLFHNVSYDFNSAGHYHEHKYSANGRATIEPQANYYGVQLGQLLLIGESNDLSHGDVKKLNILYGNLKSKYSVSECNKLFVRSPRLTTPSCSQYFQSQQEPKQSQNIRPKENADYEKLTGDNTDPPETVGKDYTDIESSNHEDENSDNNENVEDKGDEDTKEIPIIDRIQPLKRPLNVQVLKKKVKFDHFKRDPLSYLSDYHTGDENYGKKVKNVGVQYMKFGRLNKLRKTK